MHIDHIVLWVENPKQSLDFYCEVLEMKAVREQEYAAGDAPFPSVRLNDNTIIDLMDRALLALTGDATDNTAGGAPINHVCLCVDSDTYSKIEQRLTEKQIPLKPGPKQSFGAQGYTRYSFYFEDVDKNVIELRYYE